MKYDIHYGPLKQQPNQTEIKGAIAATRQTRTVRTASKVVPEMEAFLLAQGLTVSPAVKGVHQTRLLDPPPIHTLPKEFEV